MNKQDMLNELDKDIDWCLKDKIYPFNTPFADVNLFNNLDVKKMLDLIKYE